MPGAILAALCATVFPVLDAAGKGNLARRAEHLDERKIDAAKGIFDSSEAPRTTPS